MCRSNNLILKATKITYNIKLRRSKTIQHKHWVTLRELPLFTSIVTWISQSARDGAALRLLNKRIIRLVKSSGFTFGFQYLKESLRLTIRAISGTPELEGFTTPRVRRDPRGFPYIIPLSLRKCLHSWRSEVPAVRATLTMLSIFRVFPTKPKPSLESIIAPFDGLAKSFPKEKILAALKGLPFKNLTYGTFKGFISNSAGPNGSNATWTAGIDALALIHEPKALLAFLRLAWRVGSVGYAVWLVSLIALAGPVYIFIWTFGLVRPLTCGRLGCVYDQAGKARIVGITNWWIQLALRPFHDNIMSRLRQLETDGTFNQHKPLKRLILDETENKFSCFDLTTATDRLPLEFQKDVLACLQVDSDIWSSLLSLAWSYRRDTVRYSVGQPMGAYSSFASLALAHHVLVQLAAKEVGIPGFFDRYALLGDDIVIKHDEVASKYLELINVLGVKVNLGKSVISKDIAEFAKVLLTPSCNLSPIGPGVILASIRRPYFLSMLLIEACNKGYANFSNTVKVLIPSLPDRFRKWTKLGFWACYGLSSPIIPQSQLGFFGKLSWSSMWNMLDKDPMSVSQGLFESIKKIALEKAESGIKAIEYNETLFYRNWWRRSATQRSPALRFLEAALILFSPGFWLVATSFEKSKVEAEEKVDLIKSIESPSLENTIKVARTDTSITGYDLNWWDRKAVRSYGSTFVKWERLFMSSVLMAELRKPLFTMFNIPKFSIKVSEDGNVRVTDPSGRFDPKW